MLASLYADANLAVSATLSLGSPAVEHTIAAIDRTDGVAVELGGVEVETVRPAAAVRAVDLDGLGILPGDLDGGTITLNGVEWRIAAVQPSPLPQGEGAGECLLLLEAVA